VQSESSTKRPVATSSRLGGNESVNDSRQITPAEEYQLWRSLGYAWVSSQYTQPQNLKSSRPTAANFAAIVRSVKLAQPYAYPTGLIEIPLAPITDVNAFRSRRWTLSEFTKSVRRSVRWAIEHGGVYDYCFHPSVMCIEDPQFAVIDLICEEVRQAGKNAAIVNLDTIAERAAQRSRVATSERR